MARTSENATPGQEVEGLKQTSKGVKKKSSGPPVASAQFRKCPRKTDFQVFVLDPNLNSIAFFLALHNFFHCDVAN